MKALVHRESGSLDCLRIEDIEKPTPKPDEVLIAVRAAGVNVLDWYFLSSRILGMTRGRKTIKRVGRDVAGIVVAVGANVSAFKPGDEVFGLANGSFAEYVCAPATAVAIKPRRITFEQAGGIGIAGLTALQGLRNAGRAERGDKVLVNGASGGIGTFAVQLAKAFGCEVTGVCSSRNVDLVRSIGADHVIDYETTDFVKGSARYDLILDIVAAHSWRARSGALTPRGRYVFVGGPPLRGILVWALSHFVGRRLISYVAKSTPADLELIRKLIDSGQVTPVIDRTYAFSDAANAIEYVAAGHTRGKVVITPPSAAAGV